MATITKRGNLQWQAKIRRDGHPQQSKTFTTRADAERWARAIEREMDAGSFVAAGRKEAESTTLFEALKRYLREVTPGKRGADIEEYRIKAWQKDPLAKRTLASLRGADFAEWRDKRLGQGIAASTVQKELVLIQHLFKTARREWGMEALQNPLEVVRKPVADNARSRLFVDGEEARLLKVLEPQVREEGGTFGEGTGNIWIRPLVQLAIETAMRQGELLALRWENVDLKRRVAHLPMTKNGTARNVPLSSQAVAVLEGLPRAITGKVFPTAQNAAKLAFTRAVARARRDYLKECEAATAPADPRLLVDLHFHDLRHIATTRLAKRVPNVVELAAITGHKDLRMLQRYYHPDAEDLARKLG